MRKPLPLLFGLMIAFALLLGACNGDEESPPPAGAVAPAPQGPVLTATPLAQVPDPAIVSGRDTGAPATAGSPAGGGQADVTYTVEPGDALSLIAGRFGVSVEAIQAANQLDGTNIFVGQQLVIPRGGTTTAPAEPTAPPPASPPAGDGRTYVVQPGDTPLGIAFEFDVTLEALEAANGGPGSLDNLQIGRELVIP